MVVAAAVSAAILPGSAYALTSENFRVVAPQAAVPAGLNAQEKQLYANIFAAISAKRWDEAFQLIERAPRSPMASMARAELYLAPGSPEIPAEKLEALLNAAPYLPQAERLENLALRRGVTAVPLRPTTQRMGYLGEAPRRNLPEPTRSEDISNLREQIQVFIRNDNSAAAEAAYLGSAASLSSGAKAELQARIAWSYYTENDDGNARRLASSAARESSDWAVQGHWISGLASWRLRDFANALTSFDYVAQRGWNDDMRATGLYWASRAATASRQPQRAQKYLQLATKIPESFYGLMASEALGLEFLAAKQIRARKTDWNAIDGEKNVQIAIGLSEIGQFKLADETLRFQARIGASEMHADIAKLAGALNLPGTQFWLAHYGPSRNFTNATTRYPLPSWKPQGGWRVEPALVFAHTLQESSFRTDVISSAGARGLMQVKPTTAKEMARKRGENLNSSDLDQPSVNLEYGQSYLEKLKELPTTGGLLPKVIAAYNAGPTPVSRWNTEVRDNGDPLLFIESIPYWETRGYVSTILRNLWIYEFFQNKTGISRPGLVQYLWPSFPDQNGKMTLTKG